jgi:hypothetical protein
MQLRQTASRLFQGLKPTILKMCLVPIVTYAGIRCGISLHVWSHCAPQHDEQLCKEFYSWTSIVCRDIILAPVILLHCCRGNGLGASDRLSPLIYQQGGWILIAIYYYFILSIPRLRIVLLLLIVFGAFVASRQYVSLAWMSAHPHLPGVHPWQFP